MTRRRSGIMLVDMLIVIILVATAMVLASRLTVEIFNQHREVPAREASILHSQAKVAELRRAVWSAATLSPIETGVRIGQDGESVEFHGHFRIEGPVLIADFGDGEVRCVSQVMLANRSRP